MVICPIALAVGCKKCPIFSACPVKGIIGDYKPEPPSASAAPTRAAAAKPKPAASTKRARTRRSRRK